MGTIPRLFVEQALHEGAELMLPAEAAHYLGTVLRRGPDDVVQLFNGRDGEFACRIAALGRGQAMVLAERRTRPQQEEGDLWLVFALLKRDATDLVVRAATELGVSRILPVRTERTEAARVNDARLVAIAREAAEQCERLSVPQITPLAPLDHVLAEWHGARRLAAAVERCASHAHAPGAGALLVGPEGGFSPRELDVLAAKPFISAISLGPRILRAETAAIAGLTLIQSHGWPGN